MKNNNKVNKIINLVINAIANKVSNMSSISVNNNIRQIQFGISCRNMSIDKAIDIRKAINKAICRYNAYCPIFAKGNIKVDNNRHSIIIHYL